MMKKVKWKYFTQPTTDSYRTALEHQSLGLESGFDRNVEQTGVSLISRWKKCWNFLILVILHSYMILYQTQNLQDIKDKIDKIVEEAGFDQVIKVPSFNTDGQLL